MNGRCLLCGRIGPIERHHIFGGALRRKSERDGLVVDLCHNCHNEPPDGVHHNAAVMLRLHQIGQKMWMARTGGTVEDFRREYYKNYLEEETEESFMLNVVALMGRLVRDPELRKSPSGVSVTTFTIAVDRSFVRQGEQRQADFIDVVAWRATAEFVCKYFRKGSLIALKGSIQTRSYQDKAGNNRKAVEVIADAVSFAGSRSGNPPAPAESEGSTGQADYAMGTSEDFAVIEDDEDLPF